MNDQAVIRVQDVTFAYDGLPVLEHVTLDVEKGEFLGIVGPNGGGKTTLLRIILGLIKPSQGRVSVLGHVPVEVRHRVGYVPQFASFARDFPISVEETILLGRMGKTNNLLGWSVGDRKAVADVMELTDIRDLKDRRLGSLSGGQIQKVFIARSLAADPEILILDEPTANIDLRVEENIFDLLRELNRHVTILVVSHDIGFISRYVSRVACLNRTLICHQTQALGGELIRELYGSPVQMIHHRH